MPGARFYGSSFASSANTSGDGVVYLFGGNGHDSAGDSGQLNDLWSIDLSTFRLSDDDGSDDDADPSFFKKHFGVVVACASALVTLATALLIARYRRQERREKDDWEKDGTVLAPDTVVPPFAMFGGSPGVLICELPECTPELFQEMATNAFERFKPRPKAT